MKLPHGIRAWVPLGASLLACLPLLALDVFRHATGPLDRWPGFYAALGVLSGVSLVWVAGRLRRWLTRDEDYY